MLAETTYIEFGPTQLNDLLLQTSGVDRDTTLSTINTAADVELDACGRLVSNGFLLTPLAFSQLCQCVARGLGTLVSDIGGIYRSRRAYDSAISIPLAVRILNDCVRLRLHAIDGLSGRSMIQNHRTRTVDGIVGPNYQLLPNCQFIDALGDMLATYDIPMDFHEATLDGRRLSMLYLSGDTINPGDRYAANCGMYFSNSEVGETSVRGAVVIQYARTLRLMNKTHSISHTGTDFAKRLNKMLKTIAADWSPTVRVAERLQSKFHIPVSFVSEDGKLNTLERDRLEVQLTKHVDTKLAQQLVRRIVYKGSRDGELPRRVVSEEIASRRLYDIVHVVSTAAKGNQQLLREKLERAAFELLTQDTYSRR